MNGTITKLHLEGESTHLGVVVERWVVRVGDLVENDAFAFILLVVLFLGQLNAAVDAVHLQVANVRWLVALWLGEENEHVHRRELFEERVELLADVVMHLNAKLPAAVVTTVHLGTELLQDEHHLPHYFKVYRGHVVFTNVELTKLNKKTRKKLIMGTELFFVVWSLYLYFCFPI